MITIDNRGQAIVQTNYSENLGLVEISPRAKHSTLWTERGAARHAKMLDTDQAWEVFERLEDAYFGATGDQATVETLIPSEIQTLHEVIDRKASAAGPALKPKAYGEIYARLQKKFLSAELRRIWIAAEALKDAIDESQRIVIRRIVREGATAEAILSDQRARLLATATAERATFAKLLASWNEQELANLTSRKTFPRGEYDDTQERLPG